MIQKKIADFLFSTRLMAVLMIVFAVSMAVGTFLEDSYSTPFARIYVYNAKWFELIMVLLAVNFIGNIGRYRLWRREKWLVLLFHLGFLVIIIGAGITRYISFEGIMPITNGQTENTFYSQKTYLSTLIDGEKDGKMLRKKKDFHILLAGGANNHHTLHTDFKGQDIEFEITKFIEGAKRAIVEDENGKTYLKMVESGTGKRREHFLEKNKITSINNILFSFNKHTDGAININVDDNGHYTLESPFPGEYMRMADRKEGSVVEDTIVDLNLASLYNIGGFQFVIPEKEIKGYYDLVIDEEQQKQELTNEDGVILTVRTEDEEKEVKLLGSQGTASNPKKIEIGGLEMHLRYGSKQYELPFKIHLKNFIAEKYPGTANNPTPSYSSFMSKVRVEEKDGSHFDHDIFMNHVLDHEGYRFFQSSFMPDESGTVLSVNHDKWGTRITYIGYGMLYFGLVMILFIKGSRFRELGQRLKKIKRNKEKEKQKMMGVLGLLLMLGSFTGYSQVRKEDIPQSEKVSTEQEFPQNVEGVHENDSISQGEVVQDERQNRTRLIGEQLSKRKIDSVIKENTVSKEEAKKFGRLIIQDFQGRMKPINTFSSEILRKISKKDEYNGLNSDQVLISMTQNPMIWYSVPLIKTEYKNDSIRKIIGAKEGDKFVKFTQFFDNKGNYKFEPYLQNAYQAQIKSQFQKDLTKIDERVNLLFNTLQGDLLRIFPIPYDDDNKWASYSEILEQKDRFTGKDSLFVSNALPLYMQSLYTGQKAGDFTQANKLVKSIKAYQKKFGKDILPTDRHVDVELYYNEHDVFQNLFWQYLLVGALLIFFVILQIFFEKKWISGVITTGKLLIYLLFALHTVGLIARWYISGHAPWSDAYESMIFVAWATVLSGLFFSKSSLTLASTAFVTSMILMIAHWNWMDPSIANMDPVLDSYWLMIHTSVIVGSYGPFTLAFVLGIVVMLLMIFTTKQNKKKMKRNIRELTIINEMVLTIGLVLLTIGNFLGGQWANESWGRYWSWDPKETWALISIMVYAFVLHLQLVPGLRGRFTFNWITILAFGSILFTYFGVNFYLSGLHSYASGDQIISYKFIVIALVIWALLGYFAHRKYKKYFKGKGPKRVKN